MSRRTRRARTRHRSDFEAIGSVAQRGEFTLGGEAAGNPVRIDADDPSLHPQRLTPGKLGRREVELDRPSGVGQRGGHGPGRALAVVRGRDSQQWSVGPGGRRSSGHNMTQDAAGTANPKHGCRIRLDPQAAGRADRRQSGNLMGRPLGIGPDK